MIIFAVLFLFFVTSIISNIIIFFSSAFMVRKIQKKHSSLYIIGYKNGVIWVGHKSDSNVCPIGLVPVCKAKCFDYDLLSRPGIITDYSLKANFSLLKFPDCPYSLKINKISYIH